MVCRCFEGGGVVRVAVMCVGVVRVVNALLTQIDRLRAYKNVLVL